MARPSPQEGRIITVELQGEATRAQIVKVVAPTQVIVKLLNYTTAAREHGQHKGSLVAARFERGPLGIDQWRMVKEAELAAVPPKPDPLADTVISTAMG